MTSKSRRAQALVLPEKYEAFALAVAKGRSFTQACLDAGYALSTAPNLGSRLHRRPEIAARIAEHRKRLDEQRAKAITKAEMPTREEVLKRLLRAAIRAEEEGNLMAELRALELTGKELGMFVQRLEATVTSPLAALSSEQLAVLSSVLAMPMIEGQAIEVHEAIEAGGGAEVVQAE